jgi:hypothetical protein
MAMLLLKEKNVVQSLLDICTTDGCNSTCEKDVKFIVSLGDGIFELFCISADFLPWQRFDKFVCFLQRNYSIKQSLIIIYRKLNIKLKRNTDLFQFLIRWESFTSFAIKNTFMVHKRYNLAFNFQ